MSRKNPYVGPRSFQRTDEDKANFYGRPREVERLLNLLIAERIVLLHSPSGAGKTSLINAGLIPQLEAEQFVVLPLMRVNRFLPANKLEGITVANRYVFSALLYLEGYEEAQSKDPTSSDRLKQLSGMTFGEYLEREVAAKDKQIVLIFDQFEEILTSNPTDFPEKIEFFQQVGAALRDNNRWALFSMREDYVASLGSLLRPMPTRLSTRFKLELLTRKWARDAIEKPAEKDVKYDKDVLDKLTDDLATVKAPNYGGTESTTDVVGEYVEPMQLQVVCLRLWETLSFPQDVEQKAEVKLRDLKSTHVDSSLAAFYESCLDEVTGMQTERSEAEIRQWIQNRLITSAGTRGLVFMGEADGMTKEVVDTLEQRHLLRSEHRGGSRWVELTHDRFIKPIQDSNRPWLALNGLDRKTRRARIVAFSWFLVLILFWAFLEWFMIRPFRESQRYWMEVDAIHALQEQSNVTERRASDAMHAAENSDDAQRNSLINDTKSDLEAELKKPEARRHGTGKLRKKAKLLVRAAERFEKVSTQTFDVCQTNNCSDLRKALEHLEADGENNWKSFSLSDEDITALLSAINNSTFDVNLLKELTGGTQVTRRNFGPPVALVRSSLDQSILSDRLLPVQEFVARASDPKKKQDLRKKSEEVRQKLSDAGKKLNQVRDRKDWSDLQFDQELRVVEESVRFNSEAFLNPLRQYVKKTNRRSDWLNEKEKQIESGPWKYAGLFPLSTLRPKQMTILLYSLWCLLLVCFIGYLANAMGGAEQVVSGLDLTHTKVDISDALGWRLTHPTPPLMTVIAVCSLLLIHLGPTFLAYDVLKTAGSVQSLFPTLMVMPFIAAIYYARRRFKFARSLQRKELERVQSSASMVSTGAV